MATLEMTRIFDASKETVFAILTGHKTLLNWWGPEGTRIGDNNLDFSRIGPWHAEMIGPNGDGAVVCGEVIEFRPFDSVSFTLRFDMGSTGLGPTSTIRFNLTTTDTGGTALELTQSGLEAEHIEDMRNKGWNSALERLAKLIKNT
jgi:uncharacterized protein YndB with AHSA1/START domain